MKNLLLKICLSVGFFLSFHLYGMDPQADILEFDPPKTLSLLDNKFVFSLVDPEKMLHDQTPLNIIKSRKYQGCDFCSSCCNSETTTKTRRIIYNLEISPTFSSSCRCGLPDSFIFVIKISLDDENTFTISVETCCCRYWANGFNGSHIEIPNLLELIFSKFIKANKGMANFVSDFLASSLCVLITLFALLDDRNFQHEFSRKIMETFKQSGKLIPTLIVPCLHCLDLCMLMSEFDKASTIIDQDKISQFINFLGSCLYCPICAKKFCNAITMDLVNLHAFGQDIVNNIVQHKFFMPEQLHALMPPLGPK